MGYPMMDMMVREIRAVTQGPLVLIRLGSCGGIGDATHVGQVVVTESSVMITRDFNHFMTGEGEPFHISLPILADTSLSNRLYEKLSLHLGDSNVMKGLNATADSFYSSQGRIDEHFQDQNTELLNRLKQLYPLLQTLEMETFMMLSLARQCIKDKIMASACAMVFANRRDNSFIDKERVEGLEMSAGKAILETLVQWDVPF